MKTRLLIPLLLLLSLGAAAQPWCNYTPYPGPSQKSLSPAPEGYKPFYISHYGRHGSRYLEENSYYVYAIGKLDTAARLGLLTPKGADVLEVLRTAYADARGRDGDLSVLGGKQHREIAGRMYDRFPELLSLPMAVDARSSTAGRCMISMFYFCQELQGRNPSLQIRMDASKRDMPHVVGTREVNLTPTPTMEELISKVEALLVKAENTSRIMKSLFTDVKKVQSFTDDVKLLEALYYIAADLPNVPHLNLSLESLFTKAELQNIRKAINAGILLGTGLLPGATPGYLQQKEVLDSIAARADEVIRTGRPALTLRFSHDASVLPLAYLMGLKEATQGWNTDIVRIIPMAGNIQLVFYRKDGSDDILVKFLLNEDETSIPVKTDIAPYYHWDDVRRHWQYE